MADNMIIASSNLNIKEGQPLSLNLVLSAVKLAQCHLEQIPADYKDPSASTYTWTHQDPPRRGMGILTTTPQPCRHTSQRNRGCCI
eukprot:2326040-Rhodomonas_salina.1